MKLDFRNANHLFRIMEADEYKTAFGTLYGEFKHRDMPFRLTKTQRTFQACINNCLRPFICDITLSYLDEILIFSTNEEGQKEKVRTVPKQLHEFGLYSTTKKGHFRVSEASILRFVIIPDGIAIDSDSILKIEDWRTRESVWDIQVLLGFTNFYWWFIRKYGKVTLPISDLLK